MENNQSFSGKTVELPPYAPTLINSTRAIGYSIESAIADVIDNSIAAEATNIKICFMPFDAYIAILDDGIGMNEEQLQIAMQYGSRNPLEKRDLNDLGRFGLGLKTASLSQCRVLSVISKRGSSIVGARWDISFVEKTCKWLLQILPETEIINLPEYSQLLEQDTGTLVIWQDLDRLRNGELDFQKSLSRKMSLVKKHLSLVYHRYIEGEKGVKKTNIFFNDALLEPSNPFLPYKSTRPMDDEIINFPEYEGSPTILVRPYILPHLSNLTKDEIDSLGGKDGLRKLQGFYIYRNKRLVVWGTWFRIIRQGELSKLARIQVDIPNSLDELWTLDIKKSSAQPPEIVKKSLENIVRKISESSKRTWTVRGKKEVCDGICHVWNRLITQDGGILYEINTSHPLVEKICSENPSIKKSLVSFLRLIQEEIPINMLYQDLTDDSKIKNDEEIPFEKVKGIVVDLLALYEGDARSRRFYSLLDTEPFDYYEDELKEAFEKGEI